MLNTPQTHAREQRDGSPQSLPRVSGNRLSVPSDFSRREACRGVPTRGRSASLKNVWEASARVEARPGPLAPQKGSTLRTRAGNPVEVLPCAARRGGVHPLRHTPSHNSCSLDRPRCADSRQGHGCHHRCPPTQRNQSAYVCVRPKSRSRDGLT